MACITTSMHYSIIFIILAIARVVISDDTVPIPVDKSMINKWFADNVKPLAARKGALDPVLVTAEATPKTIKVRKDGSGDFKTVTEAVKSIPDGNKQRVMVDIGPGIYNEKITINRTKPFVTFYGSGARPTLQFDGTAKTYGTMNSAAVAVEGNYFVAYNVIFKNSSPKPGPKTEGAQAVALRLSGDKAALYKCEILGHQDTLADEEGRHFFLDCYIAGTTDFIFGGGKSLYLRNDLHSIDKPGNTKITAQARKSKMDDSGYSFVHCNITGDRKDFTLLGRYWINLPEVVYSYTSMSDTIMPVGWENNYNASQNGNLLFGEYKNSGPGSNTAKRASMVKQLSDAEAKKYLNLGYIEGSKWLLPPPIQKV